MLIFLFVFLFSETKSPCVAPSKDKAAGNRGQRRGQSPSVPWFHVEHQNPLCRPA